MGLIEHAAENVTAQSVAVFVIGSIIAYCIALRWNEERRLNSLGARAPKLKSTWPLGIDAVYGAVRATLQNRSLENFKNQFTTVPAHSATGEVRLLGTRVIMTYDPENIKAILATQFGDYGKGEPFHRNWRAFLGDSIFTTDGHQWHTSRQLIRPLFIKDRVSDLHCFEDHVQILFRAIANKGPLQNNSQPVDMDEKDVDGGKEVNIGDLFFRFSLDVTTDFLLGKDVKSMTTPNNPFAESFDEIQRIQSIIMRAGPAGSLVPRFKFNVALGTVNRFVNQYIERALQLSPEELLSKSKADMGYTFVHALANFTRDRQVLRDQVVAVLLAGRDTTASSLSWSLYELARHPECVKRLRKEILEHVGPTGSPTYEDLKSMPYLKHVLNESLRLYPSVPFNVRLALKDTILPRGGGPDGSQPVAVLKDTMVGYSALAMQRDPNLYPPTTDEFPDPAVFCPERWEKWHPKAYHYIPFNAGPRICVGQQFALTEMGYVLCRLFQKYERIESRMSDGGKPSMQTDIVLKPEDGVTVAFFEAKNQNFVSGSVMDK